MKKQSALNINPNLTPNGGNLPNMMAGNLNKRCEKIYAPVMVHARVLASAVVSQ